MTNKHYRKQWLSLLCSSILLGCFHTTTKFESEWQGTFDCRVANNIFPTSETTFNQIRSKVAEDQSLANCTMVIARAGGKEFRFLKRTGSNEVEFLMFGPAGQSEGLRLNLASDLAEQIRNRFSLLRKRYLSLQLVEELNHFLDRRNRRRRRTQKQNKKLHHRCRTI